MRKTIFFSILLGLFSSSLLAQQPVVHQGPPHAGQVVKGPLRLNSEQFNPGDSLDFTWDGTSIGKGYKLATLHVWVDDLTKGRRWKLRYPIINGVAEGSLALPANLDAGTYAFNFMGSELFLEMKGMVKKVKIKTAFNTETRQTDTIFVEEAPGWVGEDIKYLLVNRSGILFDSTLKVEQDGRFRIPPIIFGDTASLVFKPEKKKSNYMIELETPLDSVFTPFHTTTVFVNIKGADTLPAPTRIDTSKYSFSFDDPYQDVVTMQEVIIQGKSKVTKFEDQYVSPQFKNNIDGKTFNGLDNDEMTRFNNLFTFLQARVPGLIIRSDGIVNTVTWRNDPVSFFLDEIRVDASAVRNIPGSEIALIKTYPPPATMTSFVFGGGIAIYTKKGEYAQQKGPRYSFPVLGYTQGEDGMW